MGYSEHIVAVSLLLSMIHGGSTTIRVFVKTGQNLSLDVKPVKLAEGSDFFWKRAGRIIIKYNGDKVFNYSQTIEFSRQTFSLLLKNVQHNDTGHYTASVLTETEDIVAEYEVIVQDPVSPVNMTVDYNKSFPCHHNVTCRTQDFHIRSSVSCDAKTCSQEGEDHLEVNNSVAFLRIYIKNNVIICNHSNQVSWTHENYTIDSHCFPEPKPINIIAISGSAAGFLFVCLCMCVIKTNKCQRWRLDHPKNNSCQMSPTAQTGDPSTTYCLVGPHTGPLNCAQPEIQNNPESLYAQVEKANRP